MISRIVPRNPAIDEKLKELGPFNYNIKDTTEGLELIKGLDDRTNEEYYGFM